MILKRAKEDIWKLYKWAKGENQSTFIPKLEHEGKTVNTTKEKAEVLRKVCLPPQPEINTTGIREFTYPTPIEEENTELGIEEIQEACLGTKPLKAPGPDGIPNKVIHIIARKIPEIIRKLFQACLNKGYHPKIFRRAEVIPIRKPRKEDYSDPLAYRPISLLHTLGKALEKLVAQKLEKIAEEHQLIPKQQYGARKGRSTGDALTEIIDYIYRDKETRDAKPQIGSILALDIRKAFDNVSQARLTHDLKTRRVLQRIIDWIQSFLSERER